MFTLKNLVEKLGNLTIALMINLHLINYAVYSLSNSTTGYSTIIYSAFIAFAFFVWILQNEIKLDFKWLFLLLIVIGWFFLDESKARISMLMLFAYVGMPLFVMPNIRYSCERVLFYTFVMSVVFIPGFPILLSRSIWGTVDMDVAYSVLPAVIATIVHLGYYRNKIGRVQYLLYFIGLYYVIQLLVYGLRGPMLCIFMTFFLMNIFKFDKNNKLVLGKNNKSAYVAVIAGAFAVMFLEDLLLLVISIFKWLNIDLFFLEKTAGLISAGNLSNGREGLSSLAIEGFLENPIFGNGFDSFDYYTKQAYPHNFVLQTMFDGGLFALVPLIFIFVIGTIQMLKQGRLESISFFVFLIPIGFIYPLVSQDMYDVYYLWMLIAFLLYPKGQGYSHFLNVKNFKCSIKKEFLDRIK